MGILSAGRLGVLLMVCLDITACGRGDDDSASALTAFAGDDQVVAKGMVVRLDGSRSTGSDASDALTYAWSLTAPGGSTATLSAADSGEPTFTADVEGDYVATLVVARGDLTSAPDIVTITARNTAPAAHAGADRAT